MRIANPEDLGLFIRDYRRSKKISQSGLAELAGVSRRWLAGLESGKATVEVGLVIKTLHALDLILDVQPTTLARTGTR